MDAKMSVGLDTPMSIGLSAHPWTSTQSLKLSTPSLAPALEPLTVDPPDWSSNLPHQSNVPTVSQPISFTPRFSPVFAPLISPGVSGEIANVPDPAAPSTSLADLFRCSDYPYTSAPPSNHAHPMHNNPAPKQAPSRPIPHVPHSQPQSLPHHQPHQPSPLDSLTHVAQAAAAAAAAVTVSQPASTVPPPSVSPPQHPSPPSAPPSPTSAQAGPHSAATSHGHRSVLGSGIQSVAVQEAQMQARKKAEIFANQRKRKRSEQQHRHVGAPNSRPQPQTLSHVSQIRAPVNAREPEASVNSSQTPDDSKLTQEEKKHKRYQRRLALNRESAAVSRVRRREYVKLLEERLVKAEKERVRLATELNDMQKQHSKLKEHLQQLEGEIDKASN